MQLTPIVSNSMEAQCFRDAKAGNNIPETFGIRPCWMLSQLLPHIRIINLCLRRQKISHFTS